MPANVQDLFIFELTADVLARRFARGELLAKNDHEAPAGVDASCAGGACAGTVAESVGESVVARAIGVWTSGVTEPPGHGWQKIDDFIRGPEGLGWPSAALKGSKDSERYTRNGQFAWCGAFAAWCWSILKPEIRKRNLASCYRLDQWSRGTPRRIAPMNVQPGDIGVTGPQGSLEHIVVIASRPRLEHGVWLVDTIEGNAKGQGPDGHPHEGVSRRQRPLHSSNPDVYCLQFAVRPSQEDKT